MLPSIPALLFRNQPLNLILLCLTFTTFFIQDAHLIPVDNGVEGAPEIACNQASMSVIVFTRNVFEGHVFVKGRYDDPNCRTDDTRSLEASIILPFNDCGLRRTRQVNPRGVSVEATVVVSFHPQFITKVDRAYHIKCFYMEADKTVVADLDVSAITSVPYTEQVQMPSCRYAVLRSADEETPIRYARVGDPVYHKWTCDQTSDQMYCMTVHSCTVDDGSGNRIELLDEEGCALDQYLIGNIEYLSDLTAGRESHVFKYADKPNLFFNCQIRLVLKEDDSICQRGLCTDPVRGRKKRMISGSIIEAAVASELHMNDSDTDVDVTTDPIVVLDIEDVGSQFDKPSFSQSQDGEICLAKDIMIIAVLAFSLMSISGVACVVAFCWRRRNERSKVFVDQQYLNRQLHRGIR